MTYTPYPKTPRLHKPIIVTEKIDGTNARIEISDVRGPPPTQEPPLALYGNLAIRAGSRRRWVYPDQDNFGFARWVNDNAEELVKLGQGTHYGEWWGNGIQRGYGLDHKRLALFSVDRYDELPDLDEVDYAPVLVRWGEFHSRVVEKALGQLRDKGSFAAPGYDNPEGVIVYHTHAGQPFKAFV